MSSDSDEIEGRGGTANSGRPLGDDDALPIAGDTVARSAFKDMVGQTVGRYKLLQKIGEGGCGAVYMAEQYEPVHRRVALKLIKLGMDTREVIARFEAERQALAMMDHPNIARVLDAGATESGRPFFVMELVRGIKITDYCDQNSLSMEDRLKLFVPVCQAIQHAHQKGIIHRDIKPSNILVTLHDGTPVPKVIDFGIAKATQGRLTDKTYFTAFEQFIGTPAYMSPEQAEMSGLDVDTRTDIYSLGVLLYELLTSQTPFDARELQKMGLDAMRKRIREEEPQTPSHRIGTMAGEALIETAKHRHVDAPKLSGLLRGDLDWIVMKCLEKDRTRRYETANGLARDLERHLNQETVSARQPSTAYKLQKMFQRNRLAFASAAIIFVLLVGGIVVSTWLAVRAIRAEHSQSELRIQAEAARSNEANLRIKAEESGRRARMEAARSQQVARLMKEMLRGAGPQVAMGADTKMLRAILDQTADRLKTDLKGQPEVESDIRQTLGEVYTDLGDLDKAGEMFKEAKRLRETAYGANSLPVAESLQGLGRLMWVRKNYVESEPLLRAALDIRSTLTGLNSLETAETLNLLGQTLRTLSEFPRKKFEAEMILRRALAIQTDALGNNHPIVADTRFQLGRAIYLRQKFEDRDFEQAEKLEREALAQQRELIGKEHPQIAANLTMFSDTLLDEIKNVDNMREKETEFARNADGTTRALTADEAAALLQKAGDNQARILVEAESVLREALAIQRKVLRPDHISMVTTLQNLGDLLMRKKGGSYVEAEQVYRDQLRVVNANLPPGDSHVRDAINNLMIALGAQQKYDEIATTGIGIIKDRGELGQGKNYGFLNEMNSIAWRQYTRGRPRDGVGLAEASVKIYDAAGGPPHQAIIAIDTLGWLYLSTGRTSDAVAQFERALKWTYDSDEKNNRGSLTSRLFALGVAKQQTGKLKEAEEHLTESFRVGGDALVRSEPDYARGLAEMGKIRIKTSEFAQAEKFFRDALALDQSHMSGYLPFELKSLLGEALAGQKKYADAEPLLVESYAGLQGTIDSAPGNRIQMMQEASDRLARLYENRGKPVLAAEWKARRNDVATSAALALSAGT